jgi:hypothetical protein
MNGAGGVVEFGYEILTEGAFSAAGTDRGGLNACRCANVGSDYRLRR